MKIKISVIVPVYNVEKYIGKCIQSLLDQTFKNFEVIIIDDGSPDQSIVIAKKIVGEDPRFIFLEKENGGQGSARNMGLDYARAEYIAFIDSDDYVEAEYLACMFDKITQENADICTCDINVVRSDKTIRIIRNDVNKYRTEDDFLLCLDTVTSFMWDKLFKASLFEGMRFDPKIRTYEDSHFVFRLIYDKHITSVHECLYNYVQRIGSTTNSINPTYIKDKTAVMNTFLEFSKSKYNLDEIKDYLNYCYLYIYMYTTVVGITRHSDSYVRDIRKFIEGIDTSFYNLLNILRVMRTNVKVGVGLFVFKISPTLFKKIILLRDRKVMKNADKSCV